MAIVNASSKDGGRQSKYDTNNYHVTPGLYQLTGRAADNAEDCLNYRATRDKLVLTQSLNLYYLLSLPQSTSDAQCSQQVLYTE